MEAAVIWIFLFIVLALFALPLQERLRRWFQRLPLRILLVPAALTAGFGVVLAGAGAVSPAFLGIIAAYTFVPALIVYRGGSGERRPRAADFAAILLVWLPLEFYAGKDLIPSEAWGIANAAARGTAIVLALFLFLIYRGLKGIKYNLPLRWTDVLYPAIGFVVAAPILIALGLAVGFLGPFRIPEALAPGSFAILFLRILVAVALPEELLFRGLIQNWLMQRFGESNLVLLGAALISGAAHLNNDPAPNWGYMLLATIAGFIYGKVFQKSSTIWSSASLHAGVNAVRHVFFG